MADIRYIRKTGNLLVARLTDDSQITLYPTSGHMWFPPATAVTPPVDPVDPEDPPVDPEDPPVDPTGDWVHPHPGSVLTSPYGPRDFDGFHWGNDSSSGTGQIGVPIVAPCDMRITISQDGSPNDFHFGTAGNHVKGHALDGSYTFNFMHLYSRAVSVGQEISAGTRIGIEGATGNVTGLHLHLECFEGVLENPGTPPYGNPIDPLPVLRSKGVNI